MRSAETVLGIIRIAADTGEPGAPKGARPVRGGADGKVLTEQLASRLLYLVMAFETFPDATRVLAVLGKRLARYGLTLHPDKTRLIDFRFKRAEGTHHPAANGTTFDFLGFTHVWGKSRKGINVVRQVTAKGRYARALAGVTDWCRDNRHRPIAVQHAHLSAMMRGHYAYYGVTGNSRRVRWYAHQVVRIWQRWLSRRDRQSAYTWTRLTAFLKQRPLPPPRIVHRYVAGSEALS